MQFLKPIRDNCKHSIIPGDEIDSYNTTSDDLPTKLSSNENFMDTPSEQPSSSINTDELNRTQSYSSTQLKSPMKRINSNTRTSSKTTTHRFVKFSILIIYLSITK